MNCKGSPYSPTSTNLPGSPAQKMRFSRKFAINLTDEKPQIKEETSSDLSQLEKKLLRYRRKYREKKAKENKLQNDCRLLTENIENQTNAICEIQHEIAKEVKNNEEMKENDKKVCKKIEEMQEQLKNLKIFNDTVPEQSLYSLEYRPSGTAFQLEYLQEELFSSNKKVTDLERFLSREIKKNENLTKDLRNLKIESMQTNNL